jgi:hypothetical protein
MLLLGGGALLAFAMGGGKKKTEGGPDSGTPSLLAGIPIDQYRDNVLPRPLQDAQIRAYRALDQVRAQQPANVGLALSMLILQNLNVGSLPAAQLGTVIYAGGKADKTASDALSNAAGKVFDAPLLKDANLWGHVRQELLTQRNSSELAAQGKRLGQQGFVRTARVMIARGLLLDMAGNLPASAPAEDWDQLIRSALAVTEELFKNPNLFKTQPSTLPPELQTAFATAMSSNSSTAMRELAARLRAAGYAQAALDLENAALALDKAAAGGSTGSTEAQEILRNARAIGTLAALTAAFGKLQSLGFPDLANQLEPEIRRLANIEKAKIDIEPLRKIQPDAPEDVLRSVALVLRDWMDAAQLVEAARTIQPSYPKLAALIEQKAVAIQSGHITERTAKELDRILIELNKMTSK